jgi:hypothetical protein
MPRRSGAAVETKSQSKRRKQTDAGEEKKRDVANETQSRAEDEAVSSEALEAQGGYLVFQCSKCNAILADSASVLLLKKDYVALSASPQNVLPRSVKLDEKDTQLRSFSTGPFAGCAFHQVFCRNCNAVVGMVLCTTPTPLDALRNAVTLDFQYVSLWKSEGKMSVNVPSSVLGLEALWERMDYITMSVLKLFEKVEALDKKMGGLEKTI